MHSSLVPPLLPDFLKVSSAEVHPAAEGTLFVWQPLPRMVVTRIEGYFTKQAEKVIEVAWRRTASTGRLVSFNDWEDMTDYDSSTRVNLTGVGLELRARFDACHVLARSTTVRLGVQLASLAVKVVHAHSSRVEFEKLLREALR